MKWIAAAFALKAVVHMPVQLPQTVPTAGAPVYAIVERKDEGFYSVDFAAVPDCNGAHVCSFAHAIGSRRRLPLGYQAARVAAYCNDASLAWREAGYYYEVTLKCGTLEQLRSMRRSMRRY